MKKSKDNITISLVYYTFSPFVKNDLEILQKYFDTAPVSWNGKKDIPKIAKAVLKSDLTFSWFATDHAAITVFFSKIFRKKSIVVVGGGDVAYVPEINYGQFTLSWHKRMLTKFALKYANKVLVVDPSLKKDAIKNAKINGENIDYLPTGYDLQFWKPDNSKKKDIVLSVAFAKDIRRVKLKGFETFVKSAKYFSEKFIIVGISGEAKKYLESISPKNVEIVGRLTKEELLSYYQKAKVYCQLSIREGLPNTLCEAMLCNCIPVGTDIPGIRRVIGDNGFFVTYGNEEKTVEAIKKALRAKNELGKNARKRVAKMFPLDKREKELVEIINGLEKKCKYQ